MASKQQQLFAKIVLHNKLLDPPEVERLLEQFPDPEEIIRHLIASKKLNEKTGSQLRRLYEKQIEKLGLHHDTTKAAVDPSLSEQADIDALVEQALEEEASPEEAPSEPESSSSAASHSSASHSSASHGDISPIQVDLDVETDLPTATDVEEDLPLLERDTEGDSKPSPVVVQTTSVPVDSKAKELIHDILREARQLKASDVHITAGLAPMIRQAGSLKNARSASSTSRGDRRGIAGHARRGSSGALSRDERSRLLLRRW